MTHLLDKLMSDTLFDHLPGYVAIKDPQSRYIRANHALAVLTGFKTASELEGLTDAELKCAAAENAEIYLEQDKAIIRTKQPQALICFDIYSGQSPKLLQASKTPLIDDTGHIVGILIQSTNLMINQFARALFNVNESLLAAKPVTFEVRQDYANLDLSARECECLFYLLRGRSSNEMAAILGLSKRTIESYIENLKNKLNCTTKKDLFDKAFEYGYTHTLPASILSQLVRG